MYVHRDIKIKSCVARQISDSRGMATIEVEIIASGNETFSAKAAVPSGKSTGSSEAFEMRDADGGVENALNSVNNVIAPKIIDLEVNSEEIDHLMLKMDITSNKKYLGGNAMLGVSMAMARLEAQVKGIPLWRFLSKRSGFDIGKPILYMNTMNGGAHADFCLPFQEYIIAVGGGTLEERNRKAKELFQKVKIKLDAEGITYYMGDEGGFAPRLDDIEKPFSILTECIGDEPDVFIAIDAAASEFHEQEDHYKVLGKILKRGELFTLYRDLVGKFNLKSIEDPFDEQDYKGFEELTRWVGETVVVVGDDLTTTNPVLVKKFGTRQLANGIIIKPNQIGTLFETFEAIREARNCGWKIIVSHRSGETMDSFISDLAVGVGAFGIKAGAHTQPERDAKYERLVAIEKEMEEEIMQKKEEEERKMKERKNLQWW